MSTRRPQLPQYTGLAAHAASKSWWPTVDFILECFRRWMWLVMLAGLAIGGLAAAARTLLPIKYTANTQVLFDPRGLKVFSNELTAGYFDANSAISFVESQMGVLQSERVYTRVLQAACGGPNESAGTTRSGSSKAAGKDLTAYCPDVDTGGDWNKSLEKLRRSIAIKRAERSFLVDITASADAPSLASELAGAIVTAYMREDAQTRADVAHRLTGELSGRLDQLRESLREAEARAEVYRSDRNLVRVGDKLLVEQRLAAATTALNEAQLRLERIMVRAQQVQGSRRTVSALGVLGAEADTRTLLLLHERRNAVMLELAPLAARAGNMHPALIEIRSRLAEVDRSIAAEMAVIREAARSDLARAKGEQDSLAATVADLSAKVTYARQAEAELRLLEQAADSNRKLLESFETRAREAREFSRIDVGNLRIVSVARPPAAQNLLSKMVLWGLTGFLLGNILAVGGVILFALYRLNQMNRPLTLEIPEDVAERGPAYSMRLKAEAFARYRYG